MLANTCKTIVKNVVFLVPKWSLATKCDALVQFLSLQGLNNLSQFVILSLNFHPSSPLPHPKKRDEEEKYYFF